LCAPFTVAKSHQGSTAGLLKIKFYSKIRPSFKPTPQKRDILTRFDYICQLIFWYKKIKYFIPLVGVKPKFYQSLYYDVAGLKELHHFLGLILPETVGTFQDQVCVMWPRTKPPGNSGVRGWNDDRRIFIAALERGR